MGALGSSGRSRRRRWAFVPPLLVLGVSLGLFAYRLSVSNWYWGPVPARKSGPVLAQVDPTGPPRIPEAAAGPSRDRNIVAPEAASDDPGPAPTVADQPQAAEPAAVAQAEPADPEESIRQEAEKARAHREEIARLKEREADRLDRNPPRPEPRFGGFNPAQIEAIRRRQLAMLRQMEAMMGAQARQFEGMFPGGQVPGGRRQAPSPFPPPLPWGGLGLNGRGLPAPGFLPELPAEVQAEMDRMFEGAFRIPARPGLRRAPANPSPFPLPPPRPQPPRDQTPSDEFPSRTFT